MRIAVFNCRECELFIEWNSCKSLPSIFQPSKRQTIFALSVGWLVGQSVGVTTNSTLPLLKIKSSCDYSKVPPAPAQPAQHNGKVDILSPAAMENAYYICHNVQVGKHWAHARIPSDWLKG